MNRGYVITGTDTGVGKTIVAAGLAGVLGAFYWKPIQAGLEAPTDSEVVARLAGRGLRGVLPERYQLTTPCSPHEAASIDGLEICLARLELPAVDGPMIIEGAGGMMVPVRDDALLADVFAHWSLPVILVARTSLGTINHSLLSIRAARDFGLDLAGIIFVGEANRATETAIVKFGSIRHLGRLPWMDPLSADSLSQATELNLRLDLLA